MLSHIAIDATAYTITYPLDRTKKIYQCQHQLKKDEKVSLKKSYKGLLEIINDQINKDGFLSLWDKRALAVGLTGIVATNALKYSLEGKLFNWIPEGTSSVQKYSSRIFSATMDTLLHSAFIYWFSTIETKLTLDLDKNLQVFRDLVKLEKCKEMLTGFPVSLVEDFTSNGAKKAFYNIAKHTTDLSDPTKAALAVAIATSLANLISYPLDSIRKNMILNSKGNVSYRRTWLNVKEQVEDDGILSLWNGIGTSVLIGILKTSMKNGLKTWVKIELKNDVKSIVDDIREKMDSEIDNVVDEL